MDTPRCCAACLAACPGDVRGLSIPNPFAGLFTSPKVLKNGFPHISYDLFYLLNWLGLGLACVDFAFFTRLTRYLDDSTKGRQDRTAGHEFFRQLCPWSNDPLGHRGRNAAAVATMLYMWGGTISRRVQIASNLQPFIVSVILTLTALTSALLIASIIRRVWRVENLGFVYGMRRFFERLYGKILLIGLLFLVGSIPIFVTIIGSKAEGARRGSRLAGG